MEPAARSRKIRENPSSARSAASAKPARPYASKTVNTNNGNNKYGRNAAQNISNNINRINNINNINTAGAGTLNFPGRIKTRSADLDKYRERARENGEFPNRRRKIITGKDLTTPLRRAKVKDKKIRLHVITIDKNKKKFPIASLACVIGATAALLCLICSYIVLNVYSTDINTQRTKISAEEKRTRDLSGALDKKNDLTAFVEKAVNQMGFVKEESLQKNYVAVKSKDKAEVVQGQKNIIFRIPGILSAIFGAK